MGYLLKEALKTLCGVNQWSYSVFWKIGCQNPKLLIWEECYYESAAYSSLHQISANENQEQKFRELEGFLASTQSTCQLGIQAGDPVHNLVTTMMMDSHINIVGEGLIGRAAFTGAHSWILSENYNREAHPPEVMKEVHRQLSAGMQTVTVIPVLPHGVVQLGSSFRVMENMAFVGDVKSLFLQLGCVPGILLSANCETKDAGRLIGAPTCVDRPLSTGWFGKTEIADSPSLVSVNSNQQISYSQSLAFSNPALHTRERGDGCQITDSVLQILNMPQNVDHPRSDRHEGNNLPTMRPKVPLTSQPKNGVKQVELVHGNSVEYVNQQALLHNPVSKLSRQVDGGESLSNSHRRLLEMQASEIYVQNHKDSGCASIMFDTFKPRVGGGINPNFHKDSFSAAVVDLGELGSGMDNHSKSVSDLLPLPGIKKGADIDILCPLIRTDDVQDVGSFKSQVSMSNLVDYPTISHSLVGNVDRTHHTMNERETKFGFSEIKAKAENDLFQALGILLPGGDGTFSSSERNPGFAEISQRLDGGKQNLKDKNANYEDFCIQPSGDDLFDVLGVEFKNKLLNESGNNFINSGLDKSTQNLDNRTSSLKIQEDVSNSEGGVSSMTGTGHLLDAVISSIPPTTKQTFDDNMSCRTTVTDLSCSSVPNVSSSYDQLSASDQVQGKLFGPSNSLLKAGAAGPHLFISGPYKENSKSCSQGTSIFGSKISSWVEQGHDIKQNSSVSTAYSKKQDEGSKSNRKRLKPGENPRPRPKDRQMIQDRVKELREIVPNGAKCSIDALLERTIKHMVFLQSVTKHADKLKQTGDSKILGKDGGLLLKDNFEGGATWAYEVGSQSMVCPIIVEDLNSPRQLLVEMLCEERGLFLEIADIIRGLGLTILKGIMETRDDKVWACFAVEANRDVTRMEIFISLVRLLDPSVKGNTPMSNGFGNDNMMAQQFHLATSIPAAGLPCGLQ